jgi:hypothetical protein
MEEDTLLLGFKRCRDLQLTRPYLFLASTGQEDTLLPAHQAGQAERIKKLSTSGSRIS